MAMASERAGRVVGAAAVLSLAAAALSQDWPQWRGPNRDGVAHGVQVPARWPRALTEEWKAEVGEGIASPVVAGGSVYVFARQAGDEVLRCLDLTGGKERWRSEPYPAPFEPHPAAALYGKSPRSTPAVAEGKVYTFGVSGILSCLDAGTGKVVWRKDFSRHYPAYGTSASPLVADGLCVVPVGDGVKQGELTALDARTGEPRWRYADGSGPAYGSPVLADLAGERQVVTFTSWNLLGLSAATGKRLWRVEAPFDGQERCVTPLVAGDLIVFAEYKKPVRAVRLERGESGITAKDAWTAKGVTLYYNSPVAAGGRLFGFSARKGSFFCLDARSGDAVWESGNRSAGNASVLSAGGVVLFLTDRGQLTVVRAGAAAYEPVAEYRVSDAETHAHPVFLGDRILVKDRTTLRCLAFKGEGK
jgi:outer membrane protein assembly factor BamB